MYEECRKEIRVWYSISFDVITAVQCSAVQGSMSSDSSCDDGRNHGSAGDSRTLLGMTNQEEGVWCGV